MASAPLCPTHAVLRSDSLTPGLCESWFYGVGHAKKVKTKLCSLQLVGNAHVAGSGKEAKLSCQIGTCLAITYTPLTLAGLEVEKALLAANH